jgi:hypothetical protein
MRGRKRLKPVGLVAGNGMGSYVAPEHIEYCRGGKIKKPHSSKYPRWLAFRR